VVHLKAGPVFLKWQVEAFEKRWDRRGGRPPKPVDLTELDREVLTALNATHHEIENSGPVTGKLAREGNAQEHPGTGEVLVGWAFATLRPGRLCAAFPAGDQSARAAITRLAKARLVSVETESTRDDEVVVELELTTKGERVAATQ
jgi:hypothetical protein